MHCVTNSGEHKKNPKSEIRNPKQIQMIKQENSKPTGPLFSVIWIFSLGFVWDLGFGTGS
jgi:hypothetical protein